MAEKTKATVHCGRSGVRGVYNANHNTLEATRDNSHDNHIRHDATKNNIYFKFHENFKLTTYMGRSGGFNATKHERDYYDKKFSEGLEERNKRYKDKGKKDQIKKMNEIYNTPKTAPFEIINQIGNMKNIQNIENYSHILAKAWKHMLCDMSEKYGENFHVLDGALHMDEGVPHFHTRAVFIAKDKFGHSMPNQSQALKEMGFERPDKSKKESRYNCPLISFTDTLRETFYHHCERFGLEIDREVTSNSHRQRDILEYKCDQLQQELLERTKEVQEIKMQLQENENELQEKKRELNGMKLETYKAQETARKAQEAQEAIKAELTHVQAELERLRASTASERNKKKGLEQENQKLNKENDDLQIETAKKTANVAHLQNQLKELEHQQHEAQKAADILLQQIRAREDEQLEASKRQDNRTATIYETIPEKTEKKFLGKTTQEAEPKKYIVNAEEFEEIQKLAKYNCNIVYGAKRYEELEKLKNSDPTIKKMKEKITDLEMQKREINLQIQNIKRELQTYKNFVQDNNLEEHMNMQLQQQQNHHHGQHR